MTEEVIVVAPQVTAGQERHIGATKVAAERSLQAKVSYADLNLDHASDIRILEGRVELAANQLCDQLATESPIGEPGKSECVRKAIADAKVQIHAAVPEQLRW